MQDPLQGERGDHQAYADDAKADAMFGDALGWAVRRLMQRHRIPPARATALRRRFTRKERMQTF